MVDLTTTYLGLKLKNPLVASAAQPLSDKCRNGQKNWKKPGLPRGHVFAF